jgi:hypothetical protein
MHALCLVRPVTGQWFPALVAATGLLEWAQEL